MTGLLSSARAAPPEGFLGALRWTNPDPAFGGLSAMEMQDADHALVLTDKGHLVQARFSRNAAGKLTGASVIAIMPLKGASGRVLTERQNDSEGMDLGSDNRLLISFEGNPARLAEYAPPWDGPAVPLPTTKSFTKLPSNAGFEAVARDADGTVFVIPEGFPGATDSLPVFRFKGEKWDRKLSIPWGDSFRPVAADIGPDGRLYLLERKFLQPMAFASRLRRFDIGDDALSGGQTLLETKPGLHDNLEALSVWRDDQGKLRATMVSDNNFRWFLRTDLVEYALPD